MKGKNVYASLIDVAKVRKVVAEKDWRNRLSAYSKRSTFTEDQRISKFVDGENGGGIVIMIFREGRIEAVRPGRRRGENILAG